MRKKKEALLCMTKLSATYTCYDGSKKGKDGDDAGGWSKSATDCIGSGLGGIWLSKSYRKLDGIIRADS